MLGRNVPVALRETARGRILKIIQDAAARINRLAASPRVYYDFENRNIAPIGVW